MLVNDLDDTDRAENNNSGDHSCMHRMCENPVERDESGSSKSCRCCTSNSTFNYLRLRVITASRRLTSFIGIHRRWLWCWHRLSRCTSEELFRKDLRLLDT